MNDKNPEVRHRDGRKIYYYALPHGFEHPAKKGITVRSRGTIAKHLEEVSPEDLVGLTPPGSLGSPPSCITSGSIPPGGYLLTWIVSDISNLASEVSAIKEAIHEIAGTIGSIKQGLDEANQKLDEKFFAEFTTVLRHIEYASKMDFAKAKSFFDPFRPMAMTALAVLFSRIESTLDRLAESKDPRQISLLSQLSLVAVLEARVMLLSGVEAHAIIQFNNVRDRIEKHAERLLSNWIENVDLRKIVSFSGNGIDNLLAAMKTIDGISPQDRLTKSYESMTRLPDEIVIQQCYKVAQIPGQSSASHTVPDDDMPAEIDLLSLIQNNHWGKSIFVRKNQTFHRRFLGSYPNHFTEILTLEKDAYFFSYIHDTKSFFFLPIQGPSTPIPDLVDHIHSLAALVAEVRAMADEVAFAAEHSDIAHEVVRMCGLVPEAKNGIYLRVTHTSSAEAGSLAPTALPPPDEQVPGLALPSTDDTSLDRLLAHTGET